MLTRDKHEQIDGFYGDAILKNDAEAERQFQSEMLDFYMDYHRAMDAEFERRENYLVEQEEIRVCADCGNPLIWTFAFAYQERYCLHCGNATPMLDDSKRQPPTPELQFRFWLFNTIWSGLYRAGGMLPKSPHQSGACAICKETNENHLRHLSDAERAADAIAEQFRNALIGRFPMDWPNP